MYVWVICMANVGNYTSPMDPNGWWFPFRCLCYRNMTRIKDKCSSSLGKKGASLNHPKTHIAPGNRPSQAPFFKDQLFVLGSIHHQKH